MSESEKGEGTGFRVVDKRRFDADGEERNEGTDSAQTAAGAAAGVASDPPPAADPGPSADAGASASDGPAAPSARDSAGSEPLPPPSGDEAAGPGMAPSFSSLVLSLSTQALLCLGEITESPEAAPQVDLVAGRHLIDLLGVLEEKTRGNLDTEEAALLEQILYDLRVRFVDISRRGNPSDPS